jgi:hypothetical protein
MEVTDWFPYCCWKYFAKAPFSSDDFHLLEERSVVAVVYLLLTVVPLFYHMVEYEVYSRYHTHIIAFLIKYIYNQIYLQSSVGCSFC